MLLRSANSVDHDEEDEESLEREEYLTMRKIVQDMKEKNSLQLNKIEIQKYTEESLPKHYGHTLCNVKYSIVQYHGSTNQLEQ